MLKKCESDNKEYPYCGFCKHATNRREWEDKIHYGNNGYDTVYCEEVTCGIDGVKYHPSELGCDGEYYEKAEV